MVKKKVNNNKNNKKSVKSTVSKKNSMDSKELNFKTTAEIKVKNRIIDQVIGQDEGIRVIKKASIQRRHVLLIGEPGTGKSMLGLALAELLPKEKLVDVLSFQNVNDENQPLIRTVSAGKGRSMVSNAKTQSSQSTKSQNSTLFIIIALLFLANIFLFGFFMEEYGAVAGSIFIVGSSVISLIVIGLFVISMNLGKRMMLGDKNSSPKVIVDNFGRKQVPFFDATGSHAGALLGDVLHDPFQSGGLGTPAHERVVGGMIHKAHLGVLFVDEIATLAPNTQQELLTAIQEGKFAITGQSERSAGAMVRTEPVPCKFVLVAAGNLETIKHMHPALRSRIRGYGYEVYMNDTMINSEENRERIAVFVAQEVNKDGKIPHFSREAVLYIIEEAKRKANRKGHLTLRLRDLGGLIRAAGDVALDENSKIVDVGHIIRSKSIARSLEKQIADKYIERKKEYEVIVTEGKKVGRVNGLAVIGGDGSYSGIILPIESEVTLGKEKEIVATGKLGEIAKEAVKNVYAIIKKYFGDDIKDHDIHVQFLQTYEGVEGDSASIAVAIAVISALKDLPVKQEYAITGSLSVRGEVLPVGGVSSKVEAAINAGIRTVIVPKSNMQDIVLNSEELRKVKIIPVTSLLEVLKEVLDWNGNEKIKKKLFK